MTPDEPFEFTTGQFVEVTIDGVGEAPYTPSSSAWVKDKMEITIMKAGYVTEKMHELTYKKEKIPAELLNTSRELSNILHDADRKSVELRDKINKDLLLKPSNEGESNA